MRRFIALDSIRGICACLVALFHIKSTGFITNTSLVANSWLFVDLFFVLSGFVIAAGYGERLANGYSIRRFMFLRLGRVYPLHVAVLLMFLSMELAGLMFGTWGMSARIPFSEPRTPYELFTSLALVQIFAGHGSLVWNGPSWSIAAEVWTYLAGALALRFFGARILPILCVAALAALTLLALGGDSAWNPATGFTFVRCIYGFSLGMIGWELFTTRLSNVQISFPVATAIEIVTVAACAAFVSTNVAPLACPPLFFVAVLVFSLEGGAVSRLFELRPFQIIGLLSYSIYMIHTFVIARVMDLAVLVGHRMHFKLIDVVQGTSGTTKKLVGPGLIPDLGTIAMIAIVIATAGVTYLLIERPFREWSRAKAGAIGRSDRDQGLPRGQTP